MKKYVFVLVTFYFLFTGEIKAQKIDTVLNIQLYKEYIDTGYRYIDYYRNYTFKELMKINPSLLENSQNFKEKKKQISQIINEYGFPKANNVLIQRFALYANHQPQTSITVNFIFPVANRNETKDSIAIEVMCDSIKMHPFSVTVIDYRKIEKMKADLMKALDNTTGK